MPTNDSKHVLTPEERTKLEAELLSLEMADRWHPHERKRMAELKALLAEKTDVSA